jgi:hypothetical protein
MASEDDTFRMLSRPSFSEMVYLFLDFTRNWENGSDYTVAKLKFFTDRGWTYKEYEDAVFNPRR